MSNFEVNLVNLPPLRMVSSHGFSESPENDAGKKLLEWAQKHGITKDGKSRRMFGFNNPDPTPGSPNYGYDFWLTLEEGENPPLEEGIRIIEFYGGLYATAPCLGIFELGKVWKQLVSWRESSQYIQAQHQWLEENLDGLREEPVGLENIRFLLYLPIAG